MVLLNCGSAQLGKSHIRSRKRVNHPAAVLFFGKAVPDRNEFTNRIRTGLLISLFIYSLLALLIIVFAEPMLEAMAASSEIISESAAYIRIEGVANIFGILFSFASVALLISPGRSRLVYLMTFIRLVLCVTADTFLVSSLPFSLNLGVNGIGVSNIIVNAMLFVSASVLLAG